MLLTLLSKYPIPEQGFLPGFWVDMDLGDTAHYKFLVT